MTIGPMGDGRSSGDRPRTNKTMHASGGWDRAAWKALWPPRPDRCRSPNEERHGAPPRSNLWLNQGVNASGGLVLGNGGRARRRRSPETRNAVGIGEYRRRSGALRWAALAQTKWSATVIVWPKSSPLVGELFRLAGHERSPRGRGSGRAIARGYGASRLYGLGNPPDCSSSGGNRHWPLPPRCGMLLASGR
jgi:hypothetical protein